jgi:Ca2+-binding EF-hand superfamily protein
MAAVVQSFSHLVAPVTTSYATVVPASCPYAISTVVAKQSPWGGGCLWQSDKTAFKNFCIRAVNGSVTSPERKELYGFLAECFLDADSDRDGLVSADEFDFLIERAASLPRRFGLAPSWVECYGDVAGRSAARKEMFRQMDKDQSGKIGMEEWVEFTMAHIQEKVRSLQPETVDFANLGKSTQEEFVAFLELAMQNRHSEEFKALYEHLFKTFVEQDAMVKGAITFEEFDLLIEEAAEAPRILKLAPQAHEAYASAEDRQHARRELFDTMDKDKGGAITFDEYLNWAIGHIAQKIQDFRAGNRYVAPPAATYAAPPVTYSAAPAVTYAAAPTTAPSVTYAAAPTVTHVAAPTVSHMTAPTVSHMTAPTVTAVSSAPPVTLAAPVTSQPTLSAQPLHSISSMSAAPVNYSTIAQAAPVTYGGAMTSVVQHAAPVSYGGAMTSSVIQPGQHAAPVSYMSPHTARR